MKPKKRAFPMGYQKPKVESMARTEAGQKQSLATDTAKTKAALKASLNKADGTNKFINRRKQENLK